MPWLGIRSIFRALKNVGIPAGCQWCFCMGPQGQGTSPGIDVFSTGILPHGFLDQRGSGGSTPHAALRDDTINHLLDDMELIRMMAASRPDHYGEGFWPRLIRTLLSKGIALTPMWYSQWLG